MSRLYVVGIGPGDLIHMTMAAREALDHARVVVGYSTYLELIQPLLAGKEVVSSAMMQEEDRCREALRRAGDGQTVALVSGGDAGIYGMAGLVLELADGAEGEVEIIVIPGVSALQAAAAVLGAPLMHDLAVVSLSDLLTPWETIRRRLYAAAEADFVLALYNPRSQGRVHQLVEAQQILLTHRAAETPVGIVRNACRPGQVRIVTTLGELLEHPVDMLSLVLVGNSSTYLDDQGRMLTPRGYRSVAGRAPAQGAGRPADFTPLAPSTAGKALMVVGTASDVGKSVLTAGICRILKRRGLRVAPFKSQNMALNSFVTPSGGEIGRAQAVQAAACGIPPHTDMNPVLLKPNSDTGSQVIVQGRVVGNMTVKEYAAYKGQVFAKVEASLNRLRRRHDFVVLEGAGSIAEINLKANDIANLRMAELADCPAILVADIDRGGVFAQIVGTLELLEPDERARIKGVVINRFRGDPSLLGPGIHFVEQRCGLPVLGVVPHFSHFRIPEEDSVALDRRDRRKSADGHAEGTISVGVIRLPRMSNYTDFDPLEAEANVHLSYIDHPEQLAGLDLLILPGSKSTISDLEFLHDSGLFQAIRNFDGAIAGICGGYQMLGRRVTDPYGVESTLKEAEGLGLLDVVTVLLPQKETHQVVARLLPEGYLVARCRDELTGYEIHMGETILGRSVKPLVRILRRSDQEVEVLDGAVLAGGRVFGTYLHGIFDNAPFRTAFLNRIRREKGVAEAGEVAPAPDPYDLLADHLEAHLDMERLLGICGLN